MPSKFTLYTAADPKDPLTFVMLFTIIAPVENVYEDTVPSKEFMADAELMTNTLLPVMYASSRATTKETDPPTTGVKVMAEVVAVLNRSAKPVGPVRPVGPVNPVCPVVPVEPVAPVCPVAPVVPVEPVCPVVPVTPVAPVCPVEPV